MKVKYTGPHEEVEIVSPFTGELVGAVRRNQTLEVPDDIAERLGADFKPDKPAPRKPAARGKKPAAENAPAPAPQDDPAPAGEKE